MTRGRRRGWIAAAAVVAAAAIAFASLAGLARVAGDDMLPGLGDGAGVVFLRRATIRRGDLILFRHGGGVVLRRVIGLPGEHLTFDGMVPTVDGVRAEHEPIARVTLYGRDMQVVRERIAGAVHDVIDDPKRRLTGVPDADTGTGYYVMADLREYATDSRNYGVIPPDAVVGVVWFVWSRGDRPPIAPITRPP